MCLAAVTSQEIVYFILFIFLVLLGLAATTFFAWLVGKRDNSLSPYTGQQLRSASEMHWMTREKVLRYLFEIQNYDNQMIDLHRAAFCRETGRLFPEALTWYGSLNVDWDFIQKRHKGSFVSWGSLPEEQRLIISDKHESMEGFQTEISSPTASPRKVDEFYAMTKPGPLYVDVSTGILMGWKIVPETELEVLIVQKPKEIYLPGITKK